MLYNMLYTTFYNMFSRCNHNEDQAVFYSKGTVCSEYLPNSEELPNSEDLLTSSLRPVLDATHVDHDRAQNGLARRGSWGSQGRRGWSIGELACRPAQGRHGSGPLSLATVTARWTPGRPGHAVGPGTGPVPRDQPIDRRAAGPCP